jgi:tricorn protease
MAGSGGDMLPYIFRKLGLGPLVGTRTWGGLVGIWDVPDLVDGGFITAPRGGFYDTDGNWAVEGQGVPPDLEVEQTPQHAAAGRDAQLEAAVKAALDLLPAQGVKILPQPADPVRVKRPQ